MTRGRDIGGVTGHLPRPQITIADICSMVMVRVYSDMVTVWGYSWDYYIGLGGVYGYGYV